MGTTAGGAVCFPSEVNVPVTLQSLIQESTINPGDYIVADRDGVVVCPADLVEKVLEIIPAIAEADRKCAEAIKRGVSVQEAFKTAMSRPWILLFREPIVLIMSTYMAIIYGTLYMLFSAYPIVYEESRGWSAGLREMLGIPAADLTAA